MEDHPTAGIWRTFDNDDVQVREVYSRYGLAMFMAQVLEHGMVNALFVLRLLPTMENYANRSHWEDALQRFYNVELAKTFGNMVRALEQTGTLSSDLIARLRLAKVQRDHLAHGFFRKHDLNFMTHSGREKMVAECEDLIELFRGVDQDVDATVSPHRELLGITPEWIGEQMAQMEAEAQRAAAWSAVD